MQVVLGWIFGMVKYRERSEGMHVCVRNCFGTYKRKGGEAKEKWERIVGWDVVGSLCDLGWVQVDLAQAD